MIKIFKRKYLKNAIALIIGVMILISPLVIYAADPPAGYYHETRVGADGVRHRRTPGPDGEVLGLMYKGEVIYLSDEDDHDHANWVAVWREQTNLTGWMDGAYYVHDWKPN